MDGFRIIDSPGLLPTEVWRTGIYNGNSEGIKKKSANRTNVLYSG